MYICFKFLFYSPYLILIGKYLISNHSFFPVLPLQSTIIYGVDFHIIRAQTVSYSFFLLGQVAGFLCPGALNLEQLSDLI